MQNAKCRMQNFGACGAFIKRAVGDAGPYKVIINLLTGFIF